MHAEAAPAVMWAIFLGYHVVALLWLRELRRARVAASAQRLSLTALVAVFVLCAWAGYASSIIPGLPGWFVRFAHTADALAVWIFILSGGVTLMAGPRQEGEK